jgi:hypothetical protein
MMDIYFNVVLVRFFALKGLEQKSRATPYYKKKHTTHALKGQKLMPFQGEIHQRLINHRALPCADKIRLSALTKRH